MSVKRRDFQKIASYIHEFLLKLPDDGESAELRDAFNLSLLHMQKYFRRYRQRLTNPEKAQPLESARYASPGGGLSRLSLSRSSLSPMTPYIDEPNYFQISWISLDHHPDRLRRSLKHVQDLGISIGTPPVHYAAKSGDLDLLKELLASKSELLSECDGLGRTALMYAVYSGQQDTAEFLLNEGVPADKQDMDGCTAVHWACFSSHHAILQMLLDWRTDPNKQDVFGRSPVHWACVTKATDCLKLLIEYEANVNLRDKNGLSPGMWACRLDHIDHFSILSQVENQSIDDIDGFERDRNGRTWIHWSIRKQDPIECLRTLLTVESAKMKDDEGKTVMLMAAESGSLCSCKAILEIVGDEVLHDKDDMDRTAVHLATNRGHGEVLNYLLERGAEMNVRDVNGVSPMDIAWNRQLYYCQLIIASHNRQRSKSSSDDAILASDRSAPAASSSGGGGGAAAGFGVRAARGGERGGGGPNSANSQEDSNEIDPDVNYKRNSFASRTSRHTSKRKSSNSQQSAELHNNNNHNSNNRPISVEEQLSLVNGVASPPSYTAINRPPIKNSNAFFENDSGPMITEEDLVPEAAPVINSGEMQISKDGTDILILDHPPPPSSPSHPFNEGATNESGVNEIRQYLATSNKKEKAKKQANSSQSHSSQTAKLNKQTGKGKLHPLDSRSNRTLHRSQMSHRFNEAGAAAAPPALAPTVLGVTPTPVAAGDALAGGGVVSSVSVNDASVTANAIIPLNPGSTDGSPLNLQNAAIHHPHQVQQHLQAQSQPYHSGALANLEVRNSLPQYPAGGIHYPPQPQAQPHQSVGNSAFPLQNHHQHHQHSQPHPHHQHQQQPQPYNQLVTTSLPQQPSQQHATGNSAHFHHPNMIQSEQQHREVAGNMNRSLDPMFHRNNVENAVLNRNDAANMKRHRGKHSAATAAAGSLAAPPAQLQPLSGSSMPNLAEHGNSKADYIQQQHQQQQNNNLFFNTSQSDVAVLNHQPQSSVSKLKVPTQTAAAADSVQANTEFQNMMAIPTSNPAPKNNFLPPTISSHRAAPAASHNKKKQPYAFN